MRLILILTLALLHWISAADDAPPPPPSAAAAPSAPAFTQLYTINDGVVVVSSAEQLRAALLDDGVRAVRLVEHVVLPRWPPPSRSEVPRGPPGGEVPDSVTRLDPAEDGDPAPDTSHSELPSIGATGAGADADGARRRRLLQTSKDYLVWQFKGNLDRLKSSTSFVINSTKRVFGACGEAPEGRCKVEGNGAARLFVLLSAPNVTFENLELTGGASQAGGAVFVDWMSPGVAFRACSFVANSAVEYSTVENNLPATSNSVVAAGAVFVNGTEGVVFDNVVFEGNMATLGMHEAGYSAWSRVYGGAVTLLGASGVVFSNVTFTSNAATTAAGDVLGGAVYMAGCEDVNMVDVRFVDNAARGTLDDDVAASGGAVALVQVARIVFDGCTWQGNEAVPGERADGQGGAVAVFRGHTTTLVRCDFSNNGVTGSRLSSPSGGAVYATSTLALAVTASLFSNNRARDTLSLASIENVDGEGGAVTAHNVTGLLLEGVEFVRNFASYQGSALVLSKSSGEARDCRFARHNAVKSVVHAMDTNRAAFRGCLWEGNEVGYSVLMVGLVPSGHGVTFDECVFINNGFLMAEVDSDQNDDYSVSDAPTNTTQPEATPEGDDTDLPGPPSAAPTLPAGWQPSPTAVPPPTWGELSGPAPDQASEQLEHVVSMMRSKSVTTGLVVAYASRVNFSRTRFSGNVGRSSGLTVFTDCVDEPAIFTACVFTRNTGEIGGASTLYDSVAEFYDTVFEDNVATVKGGAIHSEVTAQGTGKHLGLLLQNCTFRNNSAPVGGALSLWKLPWLTVNGSRFEGNVAASIAPRGAAVLLVYGGSASAEYVVSRSTFAHNAVRELPAENLKFQKVQSYYGFGADRCGAALLVLAESPAALKVLDTHFDGNVAHAGGALCTGGRVSAEVEGSVFEGNVAVRGAAVAVMAASRMTARHVAFVRNGDPAVTTEGAAIFLDASLPVEQPVVLEDVTFDANNSTNNEPVYCADAQYPFVCERCAVVNTAVPQGCLGAGNAVSLGELRQGPPHRLVVRGQEHHNGLADDKSRGQTVEVETGGELGVDIVVLDVYGVRVCEFAERTTIVCRAAPGTGTGDGFLTLGGVSEQQAMYTQGRAELSSVAVYATIGSVHTLECSMQDQPSMSLELQLRVRNCSSIEYNKGGTCSRCNGANQLINQDESGRAGRSCYQCQEGGGVECGGDMELTLVEGWWLAPEAALNCRTGECVAKKLKRCRYEQACTTGSAHNRSATAYSDLDKLSMCAEGYRDDVVKCGRCENGYGQNVDGSCRKCTGSVVGALFQVLSVVLIMCLFVFLTLKFFLMTIRKGRGALGRVIEYAGDREDVASLRGSVVGLFTSFMASLQVLGLWHSLFYDLLPDYMRNLLEWVSYCNINFVRYMNLGCLAYHLKLDNGIEGFYANLMFKTSIPLILISSVYFGFRWCKGQAKLAKTENEQRMVMDYKASLCAFSVFMLMLMHPSISTTMFETFHCEQVHFDGRRLAGNAPFWLYSDLSIQCFVHDHVSFSVLSSFVIVVFVFGWPLSAFLWLKHLHDLKAVSIDLHGDNASILPDIVPLNRPVEHKHDDEDSAGGSVRSLASRVPSMVSELNSVQAANETPDIAPHHLHGDGGALVFVKHLVRGKESDDPDATQEAWLFQRPRTWLETCAHFLGWSRPTEEGDLWIRLEVCVLRKEHVGDHGYIQERPVNLVDCDPQLALYVLPFTHLYEDEYYWWQTYDTVRRLFQTSMTVIIQIIDSKYDTLYTTCVCFLSVAFQAYHTPFKEDIDDKVSIMLMVNEYFIAFSLHCRKTFGKGWEQSLNGAMLVVLSVFCVAYILYSIYVIKKPFFLWLFSVEGKNAMKEGMISALKQLRNKINGACTSGCSDSADDSRVRCFAWPSRREPCAQQPERGVALGPAPPKYAGVDLDDLESLQVANWNSLYEEDAVDKVHTEGYQKSGEIHCTDAPRTTSGVPSDESKGNTHMVPRSAHASDVELSVDESAGGSDVLRRA